MFPGINEPHGMRCDCCGREVDDLRAFGGPGDPLLGDLTDAKLVKMFRTVLPVDQKAEEYFRDCASEEDFDRGLKELTKELCREKAWELSQVLDGGGVCASWECRDCAVFSGDEYHERRRERWAG